MSLFSGTKITINGHDYNGRHEEVQGNGKIVQVDMTKKLFSNLGGVDINGIIELELTVQNNLEPSLILHIEENLLDCIDFNKALSSKKTNQNTIVENLILEVRTKYDINTSKGIKVVLTLPSLESLKMSGVSTLDARMQTKFFSLIMSGSSDAKIVGELETLNIDTSGSSSFDGSKLQSQNTNVGTSGSSDVLVCAKKFFTGKASGASSIAVYGNAPMFKKQTSGVAEIIRHGANTKSLDDDSDDFDMDKVDEDESFNEESPNDIIKNAIADFEDVFSKSQAKKTKPKPQKEVVVEPTVAPPKLTLKERIKRFL